MEFKATVVEGLKVGSRYGAPTINLDKNDLEIDYGIYSCDVEFDGLGKFKGLMHYGPKSFASEHEIYTEIYIYNFEKPVYGKEVNVKVLKKIRDVRKFKSREEQFKQIKQDIENGPY